MPRCDNQIEFQKTWIRQLKQRLLRVKTQLKELEENPLGIQENPEGRRLILNGHFIQQSPAGLRRVIQNLEEQIRIEQLELQEYAV